MQHERCTVVVPHARELLDACERVERVAAQEADRRLDRPARPLVLVAPVLAGLRLARRLEVEVRRAARRPRRARQHDAQHVAVLVLADQLAECKQLAERLGRIPALDVAAPGAALTRARRPSHTSRSSPPSESTSYAAVLAPIRRQLNAASSTPVASSPDSSACTSVVPEPANGSSTCEPRVK